MNTEIKKATAEYEAARCAAHARDQLWSLEMAEALKRLVDLGIDFDDARTILTK